MKCVKCSARIFLKILATKCEQAGFCLLHASISSVKYSIDSERGAAGLTKTGGIQAPYTHCGLQALFFQAKTATDKAAPRRRRMQAAHVTAICTGACNTTYNGACKWHTYGARMAVQHCAAQGQAPQAPMIGLDEPPGQVHSVPAQG